MATDWEDVDVKCPFYRRKDQRQLQCEGPKRSQRLILCFHDGKARDVHMGRYCCGRYQTCPLYPVAEAKYGQ